MKKVVEKAKEVLEEKDKKDPRAGWNGCPGFGSQQVRELALPDMQHGMRTARYRRNGLQSSLAVLARWARDLLLIRMEL